MNALDTSWASIPIDLPFNLPMWGREQVKHYFESKKTESQLPDEYISSLYDEHVSGIHFPDLTSEDLVTFYKFPRAVAKRVEKAITAALSLPHGMFALLQYKCRKLKIAAEDYPTKIRRLNENDSLRTWRPHTGAYGTPPESLVGFWFGSVNRPSPPLTIYMCE